MNRLWVRSPAKVNLGLHVLGKREDGFHDIETIFQEIDLFDEIELVETTCGISIETDSPTLPTGPANLVWKAADLLSGKNEKERGVLIKIKKRIPIAAGLGGGSSNASAVLSGLNKLWGLRLPDESLLDIAARIGSDAPFFLIGKTAVATGRGEILRRVSIKGDCYIVLVNPGFEISTSWAYRQVRSGLTIKEQKNIMDAFSSGSDIAQIASCMRNDLEEAVVSEYPVIADIKEMLERGGALKALMSGSGATVFGVFLNERDALAALGDSLKSDWMAFLTRPVCSSF